MPAEKTGDFSKCFFRFRDAVIELIVCVRLPFENRKLGNNTGTAQLAVYAHRVAQKQIPRSSREDRRREPMHVAIDRRQKGISQVMTVCVDQCGGSSLTRE